MTPAPSINGVPLREYVEALFGEREKAVAAALAAQEKAVAAALEAADKAVTKAEANAEKWRENANEWRGAMSDRDRELPSRREVETLMTAQEEKMSGISARLVVAEAALASGSGRREQRQETRLSVGAMAGLVFGAVGALGVILTSVLLTLH